ATIVLDDLQLAHPVAHGPAAVVMGLQVVGRRAPRGRTADREALGAVAGRDVGVELAAGIQARLTVEGVPAARVVNVEVDVVGVGLPVEDEADRGPGLRRAAGAGQPLADLRGAAG